MRFLNYILVILIIFCSSNCRSEEPTKEDVKRMLDNQMDQIIDNGKMYKDYTLFENALLGNFFIVDHSFLSEFDKKILLLNQYFYEIDKKQSNNEDWNDISVKAFEYCRELINEKKLDYRPYLGMATLYLFNDDKAKALEYALKSKDLDDEQLNTNFWLAGYYHKIGDYFRFAEILDELEVIVRKTANPSDDIQLEDIKENGPGH